MCLYSCWQQAQNENLNSRNEMRRIVEIEIEKYLSTKEYNPSPHRFSSAETSVADRTIPIVYSCENCNYKISFKPYDFEKHNNSKNTNIQLNDKIIIDKYIKNTADLITLYSLDFYCPNCNQPTTILFKGGESGYWGIYELEIEKIIVLKNEQ